MCKSSTFTTSQRLPSAAAAFSFFAARKLHYVHYGQPRTVNRALVTRANFFDLAVLRRLLSAAAAFRFFAGGPKPVLEEEEEELSSSTSSPPCKFPCASAPFSLQQSLPRPAQGKA